VELNWAKPQVIMGIMEDAAVRPTGGLAEREDQKKEK